MEKYRIRKSLSMVSGKNVLKIYVGRCSTLEMRVDSPIISFNFVASRLLDVFKE